MAKTYEIRVEDEGLFLMRAIAAGSSAPITDVELLKRFLANGLSYDTQRPQGQCAQIVNKLFIVTPK